MSDVQHWEPWATDPNAMRPGPSGSYVARNDYDAAFAAGRAAERAADGDYRELLDAARSFIQRDDVREMAAPTKLAWLVNLAPRSSVPSDPNQP